MKWINKMLKNKAYLFLGSIGGKEAISGEFADKKKFSDELRNINLERLKYILIDLKSENKANEDSIKIDNFMPILLTFFATLIISLIQIMQNFTVNYGLSIAQSIINYKSANHVKLTNHDIADIYSKIGKAISDASSVVMNLPYVFLGFFLAIVIFTFILNVVFHKSYKGMWFYINTVSEVIEEKERSMEKKN